MQANKEIITPNKINERWWLADIKKLFKIFNRYPKPSSKEISDFLPPDPNDKREFETGEELWQDAKRTAPKKPIPNRIRYESNL